MFGVERGWARGGQGVASVDDRASARVCWEGLPLLSPHHSFVPVLGFRCFGLGVTGLGFHAEGFGHRV